VRFFAQTLEGVSGFLDRGLAHFQDNGVDPAEIVQARLVPDMLPLLFQIHSVAHHSVGAIEGVRAGTFHPPGDMAPLDYAGLQALVAKTREDLAKITQAEVEALADRDVAFAFRDFKMPFIGSDFLLSFSLPNFYFHATTAYDILRSKGVPLGKRDFMGPLRLKA
jgi:hypothetical protein